MQLQSVDLLFRLAGPFFPIGLWVTSSKVNSTQWIYLSLNSSFRFRWLRGLKNSQFFVKASKVKDVMLAFFATHYFQLLRKVFLESESGDPNWPWDFSDSCPMSASDIPTTWQTDKILLEKIVNKSITRHELNQQIFGHCSCHNFRIMPGWRRNGGRWKLVSQGTCCPGMFMKSPERISE